MFPATEMNYINGYSITIWGSRHMHYTTTNVTRCNTVAFFGVGRADFFFIFI